MFLFLLGSKNRELRERGREEKKRDFGFTDHSIPAVRIWKTDSEKDRQAGRLRDRDMESEKEQERQDLEDRQ